MASLCACDPDVCVCVCECLVCVKGRAVQRNNKSGFISCETKVPSSPNVSLCMRCSESVAEEMFEADKQVALESLDTATTLCSLAE